MYTVSAVLSEKDVIRISIGRIEDPHPTHSVTQIGIGMQDIVAFGVAMGLTADDLSPDIAARASCMIAFRGQPGVYSPHGGGDVLFDCVRDNLGLFVGFAAWRLTVANYTLDGSMPYEHKGAVAASSATVALGTDRQNIDWMVDVTAEKCGTVRLNRNNGLFTEISLNLPEDMVGKVCEAYVPPKLLAKSYFGAVSALQQSVKKITESYRVNMALERKRGFDAALPVLENILSNPSWTIKDGALCYANRIVADRVLLREKMYHLPKELEGKFYIDDLHVPLADTIGEVTGRGYSPHCLGGMRLGAVCIGNHRGHSITTLDDLVKDLTIINYHSMFGNNATSLVNYLVNIGFRHTFCDEYPGLSEYLVKAEKNGEAIGEVFRR